MTWRLRLDAALTPLSSRPLGSLDGSVISALRVGAVQILLLDTPPHAAVSATVGAVHPRARPFVNAVLRKLAATGEPPGSEPWIALSHPRGLWDRWASRYGEDAAMDLMRWNNTTPDLGGFCFGAPGGGERGFFLEAYRYIRRAGRLDPGGLEGIYIQDEGAALVGRGAAKLPGSRVLDICAAPGGKTAHLADGKTLVLSMDDSKDRMAQWVENSARLGWESCFPVVADCSSIPARSAGKVVVDAPCTGTGVYRRRNDARWGWCDGLLSECVSTQQRLLDASAGCVEPGGWLVYSVCSLEPEESIGQVSRFEESHPGFRRGDFPAPGVLVRDGMLCIFPPEHHVDGHFAACWERIT